MKYISTRGNSQPRSFSQAVIEGLARDGGLLIPESFPDLSQELDTLKRLSYQELAFKIFSVFIEAEISSDRLSDLVKQSYRTFNSDEVTPVTFTNDVCILELYHGPTLAFKDVALQFLGNLFEEVLSERDISLNIIGATSGDTGSAAIQGVRGKKNITIFMLHPKGKISPIQEKQMTTVLDQNVVNIALEGTFDDAQRIVKEIFSDLDFRDQYCLGAVNSINWVRVMAQIVYYFYAAFRFKQAYPNDPIVFSVPTGNFGDIYAGYAAWKMGLPIERLILATNENDILFRVLSSGVYQIREVHATISPSMDIQISSNFERFLYDVVDCDTRLIREKMQSLMASGQFELSDEQLTNARRVFLPVRVNTDQTLSTIRKYNEQGIQIDPHTAVGIYAAASSEYAHVICLATAHPAKFGQAFEMATGRQPEIPSPLKGILGRESRCISAKNRVDEVKGIIRNKLNG